jgi:hypothetical protein
LAVLENDQVYDIAKLGNKLNIRAVKEGFNVAVRWSVNNDRRTREENLWHVRFWKDYSPEYLRATEEGPVKSGWTISEGEYLICATAIDNGSEDKKGVGTSLCKMVRFVNSGLVGSDSPE